MTMVAVTGGSGFLGRAVLRRLDAMGIPTRSISRTVPTHDRPSHLVADIRNADLLTKALEGVTAVLHLAGLAHQNRPATDQEYSEINVAGTANVLRAAVDAGASRLVFASSIAVYGTGHSRPMTELSPCNPDSTYGASKVRAERILSGPQIRMSRISLRLASLYGAGDPGNIARLARSISRGHFVWVGDGRNAKCPLHVDDAAAACVSSLLMEAPLDYRVFNVAGRPCEMREMVEVIAQCVGRAPSELRLPSWIAAAPISFAQRIAPSSARIQALRWALDKWLSDDVVDTTRFTSATGWTPKVDFRAGVAAAVRQCV